VDLGSGGGLPGLPLALIFPDSVWTLVDVASRRAAFLRASVEMLELSGRVAVMEMRAEEVGRLPAYRSRCHLIVARGFGPPAVTAECAAPLLATAGRAVISEPPGGVAERWPAEGLALLGMAPGPAMRTVGGSFQVLVQESPCPDRYPRRVGIPAKRPLF